MRVVEYTRGWRALNRVLLSIGLRLRRVPKSASQVTSA